MYSSADRLKLAAAVLKLQETLNNLKGREPTTEEAKKRNDQEIEATKRSYENKKNELLIMCSRERFVEHDVEMALL